jgi:PhnB protein
MALNPYVFFNGQCEEAFAFYAKAFGGKVLSTFKYEGSPMGGDVPAGWGSKVMHSSVDLGNGMILMGSDALPGRYETPTGFSVSVGVKEVAESERIFAELAQGATVELPIQQTFWSARFGMLVDRFGIPWMVNCDQAAAHTA